MADPVEVLTGFARELRAKGVAADPSRLATTVDALTLLDPLDLGQLYWAGRVTLCGAADDLPLYDDLFDRWFRGRAPVASLAVDERARPRVSTGLAPRGGEADEEVSPLATAASPSDVLRHRDFQTLTDAERDEINRLVALLRPRVSHRRTRRLRAGGHDRVDVARTVQAMLRDGGEIGRLAWRRSRVKPRRLVLLLDVSGSMTPYADVLLHFAHAAVRVSPAYTEVFTVGTRLTRISRPLRQRDPDEALAAASAAIPDWSGGTRLGESLRAFLDIWGQRGMARRAVVVIASDGWELGDATLLGEQAERLARLAHRIIWVHPYRGRPGFAPLTQGMQAVGPHIDDLVAGHTLDAMHKLAEVIARA